MGCDDKGGKGVVSRGILGTGTKGHYSHGIIVLTFVPLIQLLCLRTAILNSPEIPSLLEVYNAHTFSGRGQETDQSSSTNSPGGFGRQPTTHTRLKPHGDTPLTPPNYLQKSKAIDHRHSLKLVPCSLTPIQYPDFSWSW